MSDDAARTMVVVEDEAILRMVAVELLQDEGWEVIEFASADEAVALWEERPGNVAAVFTDINMPGELDGLDLVLLVARTHPHAVLVVTSGRYQEPPADLARHVRFLPKPWRSDELLSVLAVPDDDDGLR